MTPKKKRVLMVRRHVSAPGWLWDQIAELAEVDGRTVAELVRRLMVNHLRRESPGWRPLPRAQRVGSWKRASRSLEGARKKVNRK